MVDGQEDIVRFPALGTPVVPAPQLTDPSPPSLGLGEFPDTIPFEGDVEDVDLEPVLVPGVRVPVEKVDDVSTLEAGDGPLEVGAINHRHEGG